MTALAFADGSLAVGGASLNPAVADPAIPTAVARFVAVDASHAWWITDGGTAALFRGTPDGASVKVRDVNAAGGLFVDAEFVYWTELDANGTDRGRVLRIRKPL
jgi:hypothetical protein